MNRILKISLAMLLTLIMLVTIACTQAPTTTQEESSAAPKTEPASASATQEESGKTYHIRVMANNESGQERAMNVVLACEKLTEQLKAEGSKDIVEAEFVHADGDFSNKMALLDKTNDLPEIVLGNSGIITPFAESGFLIDASYVTNGEVYQREVEQRLLDMGLVGDTMYGVIQDIEIRPIWFFKASLEKLGFTEADMEALAVAAGNGEFTWEDLQALATRAKDAGLCVTAIQHRPTHGAEFRNMLVTANHGKIPYEDGKVIINKQACVDMLSFLRKNVELGLTPADMTVTDWDVLEGDWMPNGGSFCWFGGIWNKGEIMAASGVTAEYVDESYFLIPLPVMTKGDPSVSMSQPQFYGLTKAAAVDEKMHEYCKRALEILLEPELQMNTTIASSHLAITKSMQGYEGYTSNEFLSKHTYMLKYSFTLPNDINLNRFLGDSMCAAIQAAEMTTDPIDTIVDSWIAQATYEMDAGSYVIQ